MPTAMIVLSNTPHTISWRVFHIARLMMGKTGSVVRELLPQSPRTKSESHDPYCDGIDLSRPSSWRARETASLSRDCANRAVGSNVTRTNANKRNDAIKRTGIE